MADLDYLHQIGVKEGNAEVQEIERVDTILNGCEYRYPRSGTQCNGDAVARVKWDKGGSHLVCPVHGGDGFVEDAEAGGDSA